MNIKSKKSLGSGPTFPALVLIFSSTTGLNAGAAAFRLGLYFISSSN